MLEMFIKKNIQDQYEYKVIQVRSYTLFTQ